MRWQYWNNWKIPTEKYMRRFIIKILFQLNLIKLIAEIIYVHIVRCKEYGHL